jgi:hypothetical protein
LISTLAGGEWSALLPGRTLHGERAPGTLWIDVGWAPEPRSRSGRFGEEKNLDPTGTRTPTTQSSSPLPEMTEENYDKFRIGDISAEMQNVPVLNISLEGYH